MKKKVSLEPVIFAAEQGNIEAQYSMGAVYYSGEGVAKDYRQAMYWFKKAAVQGDVRAQLGFRYNVLSWGRCYQRL